MDRNLALEVVRVTEAAALASAELMGRGVEATADEAAAEAMHKLFPDIEFNGRVVIGEGEADSIPMLYIGETLGTGKGPAIEVALDALEGATSCATGGPNTISVVAIAEHGGFLRCPQHVYMEKIAVGAQGIDVIDINASPTENVNAVAQAKGVSTREISVVVLERDRHESLIRELREAGAKVLLIRDGDVAPAIAAAQSGTGVDMLYGVGGTPEGVISAAALKCVGGGIVGRLWPRDDEERQKLVDAGLDPERVLTTDDLVGTDDVFVAATGVTNGALLRGVRYTRDPEIVTDSIVMRGRSGTVRRIEARHKVEKLRQFTGRDY